jgi:acyl-CoA synthetase (NDP forming)
VDTAPEPDAAAQAAAQALPEGAVVLGEGPAKAILARAGVVAVEERRAATAEAAIEAAAALGFPIALKLDSPDVVHKTEIGGVRLGLADAAAVRQGTADILGNAARLAPGARIDGVLVQRMAPRGVELILGARHDPQFGPTILVGLGGVQAELWRDVALELAPVSEAQALAMLRGLRGFPLLDGFRGAPRCDLDAIARAVARFSAFAAAAGPRLAEAEINPLVCGPDGAVAVDGLLRLA